MAKLKYDLVIEAGHYSPDGEIIWVRGYERRGPTFSDRVIINRDELVDRLSSRKKVYAGKRVPFQASTFEVSRPVNLVEKGGNQVVLIGDVADETQDKLIGVPII